MPSPKKPSKPAPVWKGPEVDGVTFSLLSRFLQCRERFRVLSIEGLKPEEQFNHRTEYGQMWHVCEEAHAAGTGGGQKPSRNVYWDEELKKYCKDLCRRFPLTQEQIDHWYNVCKVQFPLYVKYWADHPDVTTRVPLEQERKFDVPYQLPSGRIVRLRGKRDSVDVIGKGKTAGIYLQENKTKGDVNELDLKRQLTMDLQTMMYLVSLQWDYEWSKTAKFPAGVPVAGVRYNVVRRPLSGGRGSIVRGKGSEGVKCPKCKGVGLTPVKGGGNVSCPKCDGGKRTGGKPPEEKEAFYRRVASYIEAEPTEFFMRFRVEVSDADIARFRRECLDPVLEALCNWYSDATHAPVTQFLQDCFVVYGHHYRLPYGLSNWLVEGGYGDLDEYLDTGSTVGLRKVDTLFPELV